MDDFKAASLPVWEHLNSLQESVLKNPTTVLIATPGSGKSLLVAPHLVKSTSLRIALLQPRRVAARMVAQSIAKINGWKLGADVGLVMRDTSLKSKTTRLTVMTEGVLTRMIASGDAQKSFDLIILDEFHERSLHVDLACAWCRNLSHSATGNNSSHRFEIEPLKSKQLVSEPPDCDSRNCDLLSSNQPNSNRLNSSEIPMRLLIMSATLNADPLLRFFDTPPLFDIKGRVFPIKNHYLERSVSFHDQATFSQTLLQVCQKALSEISSGNILVFLPGQREILKLREQLLAQDWFPPLGVSVQTLYSRAPMTEQKKALEASDQRRIILATNIAETSLTIPGVRAVVDSGLHKELTYNKKSGVETLALQKIALDSATQRSGRAGRLGPGHCYKLWTRADEQTMQISTKAEIHRTDPAEVLLKVLSFSENIVSFPWFETPDSQAFLLAQRRLMVSGCLPANGAPLRDTSAQGSGSSHSSETSQLTPLGRWVAQFPGDLSHALLFAAGCKSSFFKPCLLTLMILREGDPAPFLSKDGRYDHLDDLKARLLWLKENPDHPYHKMGRELAQKAPTLPSNLKGIPHFDNLEAALCYAYPHRLFRFRKSSGSRGLLSTGRGVKFKTETLLAKTSPYGIALKLMDHRVHGQKESEIQFFTSIKKEALWKALAPWIRTQSQIERVGKKKIPKALVYKSFWDLPLEEPRPQPLDKEHMALYWKEQFRSGFEKALHKHPNSLKLVQRILFCNTYSKDFGGPNFDPDDWDLVIDAIYADSDNSVLEISDNDWCEAISLLLTEAQIHFMQSFAPLSIGTRLRKVNPIDYSTPKTPQVSVVLQEAFEFKVSPKIGNNTVPLAVELLAPSRRPIEVSTDMQRFWKTSYPEVRKQYRGRYPKHAWPETVE